MRGGGTNKYMYTVYEFMHTNTYASFYPTGIRTGNLSQPEVRNNKLILISTSHQCHQFVAPNHHTSLQHILETPAETGFNLHKLLHLFYTIICFTSISIIFQINLQAPFALHLHNGKVSPKNMAQ